MSDWITTIANGKLWDFPGGIHPEDRKAPAAEQPIRRLPVAAQLVLPLRQHAGQACELQVKVGERVLKGQPLTQCSAATGLPLHAPTSGTVVAIEERASAHPSALPELALILDADGQDQWYPHQGLKVDPLTLDRATLIQAINQAGIAGLGGAGFPTARKLNSASQAELLIINGAECEPYISCDDLLMREHGAEVMRGIDLLAHVIQPKLVLIAVEDNKPKAIAALKAALGERPWQLRVVPTKYPAGGERQLIQLLTGREIASGGYPSDIGIVMQNVGTAFAVKRALDDGEPLIERLVTLCGGAISQPGNYWVPLGTQVGHLLAHVGWKPYRDAQVIMGGPMMGFALPHTEIPVVKISNCILAPAKGELDSGDNAQPCIRCGACAEACPASLLPQQLLWHATSKNHDKAREYNLFDCIECGACAYVCPSAIPLVHHYRIAKAEIRAADLEAAKAELARERFEARQQRLERERQEREQRHLEAQRQREASATSNDDDAKAAVQAALARAQARRAQAAPTSATPDGEPDNSAVMAERARRRAEREAQQAVATNPSATQATVDPAKAAVAAAVARAKAKQAAQQAVVAAADAQPTAPEPSAPVATDADKKAAVAAAVARAKAKQAAQQAVVTAADAQPTASPAAKAEDDEQALADSANQHKAEVAAAVARAKARKAKHAVEDGPARQPQAELAATPIAPEPATLDAKKAAVSAAVARAKAKQAERAAQKPAPKESE